MANEDVIAELPEYYAHKPVRAAKLIDGMPPLDSGLWQLEVELPNKERRLLEVTSEWMQHQDPVGGGYIVIGADGQLAYSKAADFEPTFTKDAVVIQKGGKDVISREHLFELNSQGEPVLKADVVIDQPIDVEP